MEPINVVVTCTNQKTASADPSLRLGTICGDVVEERVAVWKQRCDRWSGPTVTARSLYAGDHWSVARGLEALRPGRRPVQLWVISAGFGLLSLDMAIPAYSATFTTGHPDTVVLQDAVKVGLCAVSCKRAWWNGLLQLDWGHRSPVSLVDLATQFPRSPLIVAASTNYLQAILDDLLAASEELQSADQLALVSGGTEELGTLSSQLVPCDARLQPLVGGILGSLNVRALRYYLETCTTKNIGCGHMTEVFNRLLAEAPDRIRYERLPLTDEELRRFVQTALRRGEQVTQTRLLRELRASGRACEQTRFRTVFRDVKAAWHD
jgi:hypothetical protein